MQTTASNGSSPSFASTNGVGLDDERVARADLVPAPRERRDRAPGERHEHLLVTELVLGAGRAGREAHAPGGHLAGAAARRGESGDERPVGRDLAILVVGAAHAIGAAASRAQRGRLPGPPAARLRAAGAVRAATGLTALADLLGVTKQAVGPVVDEMVALGLVERGPDPGARRAKRLALTDRGRAARATALEVSAALEREIADAGAVRAGLLALIEAEGLGEDAAHRRARPV
jgi:hypothetical protein